MALMEDGRQCSMCLVSVPALVIVKRMDVCRSELDYLSVASQYSVKSINVRFKDSIAEVRLYSYNQKMLLVMLSP